jgi:hypothetical protein
MPGFAVGRGRILLLALAVSGSWTACANREIALVEAAGWAEYSGIFDEPVRLESGRYVGPPYVPGGASRPELVLLREPSAEGDLDADGASEAVVVLVQSMGGTGSFVHLVVLGRDGSTVRQAGHASLGDRVRVDALRIRDGLIYATLVEPGPGDPSCCPTDTTTRTWRLGGTGLVAAP